MKSLTLTLFFISFNCFAINHYVQKTSIESCENPQFVYSGPMALGECNKLGPCIQVESPYHCSYTDSDGSIDISKKAIFDTQAQGTKDTEENHKTELSGVKAFIRDFDCNTLSGADKFFCKYIKHKERL